ncbi:unnamed protein product [Spirodela intermedia]|uniref:Uncharacterized protein n=1 Tax=Spirodela intermedia TaxID=51605 RepID=A0ABN7EDL1_SPIIN|nr:unnamed protein product [Spirodela intermedia]
MEGSVDVTEDPLVHSIKAQISEADDLDANSRFKKPIIHRMRTHVRDEDPGACRPKVVSIGPFHHGDASLRKMETLKRKFTYNLFMRSRCNCIDGMIDSIRRHEEEARAWYSEELELDSNEFVEMMIFDGCFLIELFLTYFREGWVFLWRELFRLCDTTLDVVRDDCLMIENQIPFFLLEELFFFSRIRTPHLWELATEFLEVRNMLPERPELVYHLLHLLHSSLDPRLYDNPAQSHISTGRSAGSETSPGLSTLDTLPWAMHGGETRTRSPSLEIPSLTLEESTKARLQNLIILELVHPQVGDYFTCYATLMGSIIKTTADVEILRRCGILYGKMQNDEAAHMFKSLHRIAKCD